MNSLLSEAREEGKKDMEKMESLHVSWKTSQGSGDEPENWGLSPPCMKSFLYLENKSHLGYTQLLKQMHILYTFIGELFYNLLYH